jgi:hypothetical protein
MSESAQFSPFGHSEIWQAANALIGTHGEHALNYALRGADLSLQVGDFEQARRWRMVWEPTRMLIETS